MTLTAPAEPTYEEFRDAWLADVQANATSSLDLSRRFARKLFTQWMDIGEHALDPDSLFLPDGSGDGGLDLAYLLRSADRTDEDDAGDVWYIVQSKYGTAHKGADTLLVEAQKTLSTLVGLNTALSGKAQDLVARLTQFRKSASPADRITFVFATTDGLSETERHVLSESVLAMGRQALGEAFTVAEASVRTLYDRQRDGFGSTPRTTVPLRAQLVASGEDLYFGATPLLDLYAFLKAFRAATDDLDALYEKNVRRFLGRRRKVNRGIESTLHAEPQRFGLYNNGITIVAADVTAEADGTYTLVDPFVVNGCQTTRSVWEVCQAKLEAGGTGADPELEAWTDRARSGVVVTKVVRVGAEGDTLLEAITRYTNSQNSVQEKDFLALRNDFRVWKDEMAERYSLFLEIQRGAWDAQRARQERQPDAPRFERYANAFDLLKVYGAGWLVEPGYAYGRNAAYLPGGSVFKKLTEESSITADDLYAAYRLQREADRIGFGRGAERTRRQTRHLFYMVALALLRDVLIEGGTPSPSRGDLTQALLALSAPNAQLAMDTLSKLAVNVVDRYLTEGEPNSVFHEPAFRDAFNSDLNGFLKWEALAKSAESTPRLYHLIDAVRSMMSMSYGDAPAPRAVIASALQA